MDFSIKDIDNPQESPSRDNKISIIDVQPKSIHKSKSGLGQPKTSSYSVFNAKKSNASLMKDSDDKSDISDFQIKRVRADSKATSKSRPKTRYAHSIKSVSGISGNVSIDPKSEAALELEENIKILWYDHQDDIRDILYNFQEFQLYGIKREYDHDDKIFQLAQKARQNRTQKDPQPSFISSADPEELDDNVPDMVCRICRGDIGNKPKNCEFCTMSSCQSCAVALRKFPQQIEIEGAKDEAPRGICCKVCVRKLFFRDYLDDYLYKGTGGKQGLLQRDDPLSLKHRNLKTKLTELQGIKQTMKVTKCKINKQEENFAQLQQTEEDNIELFKDGLQELNDRKARKDKRIQNRQLEHDKLRNEKEQLIDDSNKMEFDKIDLTNKVENQKNDNKYLQDLIKEAQKQIKSQKDFEDIRRNQDLMDSDINLGKTRESPAQQRQIKKSPVSIKRILEPSKSPMGFDMDGDAQEVSNEQKVTLKDNQKRKQEDIFKKTLFENENQESEQTPLSMKSLSSNDFNSQSQSKSKKKRSDIRKEKYESKQSCCGQNQKCSIF